MDDRALKFLDNLRAGLPVTKAAKRAKVPHGTVYRWRSEDSAFAEAWKVAEDVGTDLWEEELQRRAVEGNPRPVFGKDGQVGEVKEYSDTLLIFGLKGRRPEKYRDNMNVTTSGSITVEFTPAALPDAPRDQITCEGAQESALPHIVQPRALEGAS